MIYRSLIVCYKFLSRLIVWYKFLIGFFIGKINKDLNKEIIIKCLIKVIKLIKFSIYYKTVRQGWDKFTQPAPGLTLDLIVSPAVRLPIL